MAAHEKVVSFLLVCGFFQSVISQCIPGTYSETGDAPCTPCAAGTYTLLSGATSCEQSCPAGKFGIREGASVGAKRYPRQPMTASPFTFTDGSGLVGRFASSTGTSTGAFDWNTGTYWSVSGLYGGSDFSYTGTVTFNNDPAYKGEYAAIDLGESVYLYSYELYTAPALWDASCRGYRVYASNSESNWLNRHTLSGWTIIDQQMNADPTDTLHLISNSTIAYRYYAFVCNRLNGPGYNSNKLWQLYDIVMYANDACTQCPAGTYSELAGASDINSCTSCDTGSYNELPGSTSCTVCPAGSFSPNTTACIPCPMGMYSEVAGSTSCDYCAAGSYSQSEGRTSCVACEAGSYNDGNALVDMQVYPRYDATNSPFTYPDGTVVQSSAWYTAGGTAPFFTMRSTPVNQFWRSAYHVASGSNIAFDGNTTLRKPVLLYDFGEGFAPDQYVIKTGDLWKRIIVSYMLFATNDASLYTTPGVASGGGWVLLDQQVSGNYDFQISSASFVLDRVGDRTIQRTLTIATSYRYYALLMMDTMYPTDFPSVRIFNMHVGSCKRCAAGYASSEVGAQDASTCQICPAGTYSVMPGSSECTQCPAGSYSVSEGSSSCVKCSNGYASAVVGANTSSVCTVCPGGTFAISGQTSCTDCLAGTYSNAGASTCTRCNPGTASSDTAASGSASCATCDGGTYSLWGYSSCINCGYGTYSSSASGASSCISCNVDYSTTTIASTSITACTASLKGWVQVGADIDGDMLNDQMGYSVSMSKDGSCFAAGLCMNAFSFSLLCKLAQS